MEAEHALPRGKVRRPFALRPNLGSFHTYDALIKHIMGRASGMGLTQAQLSNFEKSLSEIASSLERLNIRVGNEGRPGNKKAALCLISEIAFCYRNPVQAIGSLSNSYSLIVKMAENVREGMLRPAPDILERRVAECKSRANLLCSVSGLRQIRRDAVARGEPRNSAYPLPEISNPALAPYVNVGPSLRDGRAVDPRRPIQVNPAEGEEREDYGKTIALITKRFSSVDKTNAVWFRTTLEEIADSLSAIPFKVSKRRLLCLIAETCLLYKSPSQILDGFRRSYAVLREIAKTVDAGRKCPVSPGKEKEAEDFARKVRKFGSLSGLTRIRTYAALSTNGSGSTYGIEFVSLYEFKEITYGKGKEVGPF